MSSALVLLVLAAAPELSTAPEPELPHFTVSIYPGGTSAGAAYGFTQAGAYFYFPVGVSVPLRPDLTIDVDTAFSYNVGAGSSPGGSFSVSAGPTWFPWAKHGLDGFFIGPRFQFEVSQPLSEVVLFDAGDGANGPVDLGSFVRRAFLVGVDVGWQFHLGRWVFGPMLGVSVGYAFDNREQVISPFDRQLAFGSRRFGNNFAPSVNLQFFKLGQTF
ncbi:MAG: hypothetical protein QM723_16430 [Myxococcaceae bacterium]